MVKPAFSILCLNFRHPTAERLRSHRRLPRAPQSPIMKPATAEEKERVVRVLRLWPCCPLDLSGPDHRQVQGRPLGVPLIVERGEAGVHAAASAFFTAQGRAANSSVALAFAVGRGYEATDAAKRLKFGASPTDGVAETGIAHLLSRN